MRLTPLIPSRKSQPCIRLSRLSAAFSTTSAPAHAQTCWSWGRLVTRPIRYVSALGWSRVSASTVTDERRRHALERRVERMVLPGLGLEHPPVVEADVAAPPPRRARPSGRSSCCPRERPRPGPRSPVPRWRPGWARSRPPRSTPRRSPLPAATSPSGHGPCGGSGDGTRYRTVRRVNIRKPITTPGMYASMIGITHAMTGPIASRRSERQGAENQTPNATYAAVRQTAIANRTVGRPPTPGRRRRVTPPSRARPARELLRHARKAPTTAPAAQGARELRGASRSEPVKSRRSDSNRRPAITNALLYQLSYSGDRVECRASRTGATPWRA